MRPQSCTKRLAPILHIAARFGADNCVERRRLIWGDQLHPRGRALLRCILMQPRRWNSAPTQTLRQPFTAAGLCPRAATR